MSLTESELAGLESITRFTAALSIVGVVFILVDVGRKWSHIRRAPSRIVIWWTIASSIPLPVLLIGRSQIPVHKSDSHSATCTFQGITLTFGFISSSLWAGAMAFNIYLAIVKKVSVAAILRAERIYHAVAWGIPFLLATLPIVGSSSVFSGREEPFYGGAVYWCWISSSWIMFRLYFFYMPLWVIYGCTIAAYATAGFEVLKTFRHTESLLSNSSASHANSAQAQGHLQARMTFLVKTSLFLVAFVLTYSGSTVNRLDMLVRGKVSYALSVFQVATLPLIGVFAAAAYFAGHFVTCFGLRGRARSGQSSVEEDWTSGGGTRSHRPSSQSRSTTGGSTSLALQPVHRAISGDHGYLGTEKPSSCTTIGGSQQGFGLPPIPTTPSSGLAKSHSIGLSGYTRPSFSHTQPDSPRHEESWK